MKLATMKTREQILVLVAATVLLGGGYGLLRYRPALKALNEMQAQTKQTEERLKTTSIPDAPDEDPDELREQLADADNKLAVARARIAELESEQPTADAQEVKLRISELAQAARLLVRENEAYVPGAPPPPGAAAGGGNSRAARRAARAAAKAQAANTKNAPAPTVVSTVGLEMLGRYAQPGSSRPLQRLSLEGYYADIRYFLDELQKLPWRLTVAQLQLETDTRPVEPGMPQPLRAILILAL